MDSTHRSVELGVAEAEHATVRGHQPVAGTVRRDRHPDDRLVQHERSRRTVELGVTEREDPTVGGHQPVAGAVRRDRHADDRFVEGVPPMEPR